jgi:Ni,Fe-hydrogenase III large subunit
MPERHKVRAPSYVNIPSLKPQLIGYTIADAPIIIGSIDPCFSCTNRVSVVDVESREERILTEEEFIELSRKHGAKT